MSSARPGPPVLFGPGWRPAAANSSVAEFLRGCPLVTGIDDQGLEQIAALCSVVTFNAREQIFAEGECDDGLWVLMGGQVRLYHSDSEGRHLVVGFPGPYSTLDPAALDGHPHTVGAMAVRRSQCLFVSQAARAVIVRRFPETVPNLMRQLSRDLRQRDVSHAVLFLRSARGRIACALLQLAMQYGVRQPGGVKIDYRLTRQDIADRAGVTLETSIRIVSDLQRRGAITTRAQRIEILDEAELESWSRCNDCDLDCSVFREPASAGARLETRRGGPAAWERVPGSSRPGLATPAVLTVGNGYRGRAGVTRG